MSSRGEIDKVGKEITRYQMVKGAMINRDKSFGFRLDAWKGTTLPGAFLWANWPVKILGIWFGNDLLLEINKSVVRVKAECTIRLQSQWRLSSKGRA